MSLPDAKDLKRCFVDELISRNQQAQNAKDIEPFIPDRGIGLGDPQYLANQLDIGEENMLEWINNDVQALIPRSDVVFSSGYMLQLFQGREVLEALYGEDALLLFYSVRDIPQLIPVVLAHNLSNSAFRSHFLRSISTPLAAVLEIAFQTNTSTTSSTQTADDTSRVDEEGQKSRKREIEEVGGKLATGEHKRVRLFSEGSSRSSIPFPPLPSPKRLPLQTIDDTTVPVPSLLRTSTKPELDSSLSSSSALASSSPILSVEEDNFFFADFELIPLSEPNNPSTLTLSHPRPYQCEDPSLAIPQSTSGIPAPFYRSTAPTPLPTRQTWDPSSPEAHNEALGERTLLDTSDHLNPYSNTYTPNPQSIHACPHSDQRASRAPSFDFATPMSQVITAVPESSSDPHSIHAKPGQPAQHLLERPTKLFPLPLPLPPTPGTRALRHVQPLPQPPQSTPRSHFRHLIERQRKRLPLPPLPPHPRSGPGPQVTLEPTSIDTGGSAESKVDSAPTLLPAPSAFDLLPPGSDSSKPPSLPRQEACSPPPPPLSPKSTQSNLDPEYSQQTPLHVYPPPGIPHCAHSQLPQPENPRERSYLPFPAVRAGVVRCLSWLLS
ncbi:hypothetical protein D9757_004498 [Collybiopsis confluens]|uniref:Uncharacterized protein n=1 Tax=Collybiopsis confluens TaxID=2823264 RepID=A0A8H5MEC4_9AGAR|nr:hypothetical protein D9757_004498 [Collybiopsis confluens]